MWLVKVEVPVSGKRENDATGNEDHLADRPRKLFYSKYFYSEDNSCCQEARLTDAGQYKQRLKT